MKRLARLFLLVSMSAAFPSLAITIPQVAQATTVLILTDNSGADAVNGAAHVSALITAFMSVPGAAVTTDMTELTAVSPTMLASLITANEVVIVVTVSGAPISPAAESLLQTAVSTLPLKAFMFFTDACSGCTIGSASAVLPILNAAGGGFPATLGSPDDSGYVGTRTGAYSAGFAGLPTILGTAYSPLVSVPAANVIYTTNAPFWPGPSAVVAPGNETSACVFLATDVTPFVVTGGQANALALAYLNAAMGCPLQPGNNNVPAVGTFGLILLCLILLVTGGWVVRRRWAAGGV